MSELPSGVVTFLFTDIEGSTRLVKTLRERYPQILAEHRRLVRAAVASHGGHEVDTQGDAFFVAFAGAKQAVQCALEIQRALAGHEWPAGALVRVRIGIHTGNAVPAGGGYTGLAVHRTARICAAAHGGQVLVANEDRAGAQALFEQSLPLYRRAQGKLRLVLTAAVQGILGQLAARCGDYSRASELLGQSQALLAELDDHDLTGYARFEYVLFVCMVNNILGHVRLSQGDLDGAARQFSAALAAGREGQDRLGFLVSLYNLAASSRAQGDLAGAAGHLKEGLAVAAEAGDETSAAYYLEGMAAVASLQDNPERAVRLLTAASSMLESSGSGWLHAYIPRVPHDDAVLAALRSRTGDAAFGRAQAWGRSTGHKRAVEYALG